MATREQIQEHLNAMAHWDSKEFEMREWLREEHALTEEEADVLIKNAFKDRSKTIRKRSTIRAMVATIAAIPLLAFAWLGLKAEDSKQSKKSWIVLVAAAVCLAYAAKNVKQIVTGNSDTAIDA